MKFKSTLAMAIGLGAISGYYFLFDIPQEKKKKEEKELAEKLFQFEKDKIQSITLNKKGSYITLQKKKGLWRIEKPIQANTDANTVDFLITVLQNARFTRVVDENPTNLNTFGLQKPQLKINLASQGGKEQTLMIGDSAPIGSFLYAQREGEAKVLLSPANRSDLDKSIFDLRDKTVLKVATQDINSLELSNKSISLKLTQKDKQWIINSKDLKERADSTEVTSILEALDQARAMSFVEEKPIDLKNYGLEPPHLKISLTYQDGSKHLLIGKPDKKGTRFAKTGHTLNIITINDSLVNSVSLKPLDYLSKKLFEFEDEQVKSFSIHSQNKNIDLILDSKEPDQWKIQRPIKADADKATVNSLIFDLKAARIAEYIQYSTKNFKTLGLDPAKKTFKLETKDGGIQSLNLGNQTSNGKKFFANRQGEASIFLIETGDMKKIFRNLHDLRNKKLLAFNIGDINKIQLKYPDKIFELKKIGESWNLIQPTLIKDIKDFLPSDILWTLNNLEFSKIVDPLPDQKTTGLASPYLTVTMWTKDNKTINSLHIGPPQTSTKFLYAQVKGKTTLYQIQTRFLDEIPSDLKKFKS